MSARHTVVHLPHHCPACEAPMVKWATGSIELQPSGTPIRAEGADYDCGLVLAYQGSVKNPAALNPCGHAYEIAVELRKTRAMDPGEAS